MFLFFKNRVFFSRTVSTLAEVNDIKVDFLESLENAPIIIEIQMALVWNYTKEREREIQTGNNKKKENKYGKVILEKGKNYRK